jgi:glycosyltransferase involved in cell wall biosynthesis
MTRKLLFVVNVDWFFVSHRLPIALAAMEQGYEVHLACALTDKAEQLKALGIRLHALPLSRSGTSVKSEVKSFYHIYQLIKQVRPDVIHMVTIKPVLYAGIASRLLSVNTRVASISGLGFVFMAHGVKAAILRSLVSKLYRLALHRENTQVIFQNPNDRDLFLKQRIIKSEQVTMIRGSGVSLEQYPVQPEPAGTAVVMLVARLLTDKGVLEFVEAARQLKAKQTQVRMVLVGDTDENPKSVSSSQLEEWTKQGIVEHWGYSTNVAETMAKSHIVVLPSYREGLPKSLIEAAACGRAVITTDVPGCRDAITPQVTGLLIPVKNAQALADAIELLVNNSNKRQQMGLAGRALAEQAFTIENVIQSHLMIYGGMRNTE